MINLTDLDLARHHQFKFRPEKDLEPAPRVVSELDIVVYIYNHSEQLTYVYCVPHEYQPLLQQARKTISLSFCNGVLLNLVKCPNKKFSLEYWRLLVVFQAGI